MPLSLSDVHTRAKRVRLLLLDVDGVLTDGTVHVADAGGEAKTFFIRDGLGIVWARADHMKVGILSGRPSAATARRAEELHLDLVVQGGPDKARSFAELMAARDFQDDEVAYMGDDLLDLPIIRRVGLSAAPADAVADVRSRVHWVSQHAGGRGAVREFIEVILQGRGTWDRVLQQFLS